MKILLQWTTSDSRMQILFDALKREGHEIVYWVGDRKIQHMTPDGAIFHDVFEAWDGARAESFMDAVIDPPSAELIKKMYRTESITLSMMNKHYDDSPVDDRKHVYYSMLGYWNYVIDQVRPDVVILGIIPHTTFNYVLHELARERGIKTVSFEDISTVFRTLAFRDFWKGSEELQDAIKKLSGKSISENDLGSEMRENWDTWVKNARVEQEYITLQRKKTTGTGLFMHRIRVGWKSLLAGTFFKFALRYVSQIGRPNLKREYAEHVKQADLNIPFIYFPLHYQPERTTTPQGDMYHDQLLVIETLSASLPEGWQVYVKEHPVQWLLRTKERYSPSRYRGYYKRLSQIPNVRLIPMTTHTFDLIERSKTVAVITGTAGWESLFHHKRPLVFGIPWFRDCPGIYRIDSTESCRRALNEIKNGARSTNEDILTFLKAYDETAVRAYIEPPFNGDQRITSEENMRTMAEYTCDFLKKV